MNFHETFLNWILNWINFGQNTNIELIQFGYKTWLTLHLQKLILSPNLTFGPPLSCVLNLYTGAISAALCPKRTKQGTLPACIYPPTASLRYSIICQKTNTNTNTNKYNQMQIQTNKQTNRQTNKQTNKTRKAASLHLSAHSISPIFHHLPTNKKQTNKQAHKARGCCI